MIKRSCASGSGSSTGGEIVPLIEVTLRLVRWLGEEGRMSPDAADDAVSRGESARLSGGEKVLAW